MPTGTFNINQINVNVTDVIPPENFATITKNGLPGNTYSIVEDNEWRAEVEQNVTSGIKGVAKPDDTVPATGFFRVLADTATTYTNYIGVNDAPIEVTDADLNIVNGVQRNEVIFEVTDGVTEKKVFAKVGADGSNGTATIPKWVAGDYSPDAMVVYDFVQYIAPLGASSTDVPNDNSTIWKSIGVTSEKILDVVLENETYIGDEWSVLNKVIGAYIIEDTVSSFSGYDYIKITDVTQIKKLRLSGRTRNVGEPTIHVCYGKLTLGGFEIIYDVPDTTISNLEITIEPNKFSALYVNLRNSTPTTIESLESVFEKIYSTPTDLNTEIQDVKDWVADNMETVKEETIPAMFDYTILSDGTFTSLGADYRHTDYFEFKAGDKLEIEYSTNATLYYLFTFTSAKVFIEALWQETTNTGGRKTKLFEPDFDGFLALNSNFQNTLGLPKIIKIYEQIRFLTPQSGGGGVAQKAHFYDVDAHYLESDAGDYGITLNRIFGLMTDRGGILDFGVKDYRIDTPVLVTKSAVFRGLGCMEFYGRKWMTGIYTTSGTMDMISVAGAVYFFAGNIHFYNIAILPTAGSGLRLKGSTPASGSVSDQILSLVSGAIIQNCSFEGFYDNMMFDNACQWTLINPLSNYAVRYGLYIDAERHRDAGDSTILGGNFYGYEASMNRVSKSHIYHKGSGGLKITSVKFNNKADYSILGEIAGDTVILNVSNCSFENHNISAVKYSKTSPVFRHINISNCEFASYKSGTTDIDISSGIQDINIIGNSFQSEVGSNTAINLNGINGARLMNTYRGYTNPKNVYNCVDVKESALQDPIATNINK